LNPSRIKFGTGLERKIKTDASISDIYKIAKQWVSAGQIQVRHKKDRIDKKNTTDARFPGICKL
jgi:hypothetical protein